MLLAHDPGDDNTAEEMALLEAEYASQRDIAKALRKQFKDILPPDAENMDIVQLQKTTSSSASAIRRVHDAISAAVRRAVDVGVNIAADQLTALSVGFDYTMIHTAGVDARMGANATAANLSRTLTTRPAKRCTRVSPDGTRTANR